MSTLQQPTAFETKPGSFIFNFQLSTFNSAARRGMTLVELLVVISIMVMLVAVSVPMFKPMLESQRTAGGARVVSMALQRARVKAIQERKPYGVEFLRFDNADNASLQIRLVKAARRLTGSDFSSSSSSEYRIKILNGTISFFQHNGTAWTTATRPDDWNSAVQEYDHIQLGHQGRTYEIDSSRVKLRAPYDTLTMPDASSMTPSDDQCMPFTIVTGTTSNILSPMVVMPRGTIVDLYYSGVGIDPNTGVADNAFEFTQNNRSVIVTFSPAGYVDSVTPNYSATPPSSTKAVSDKLIYFCVGEWDRQVDRNGNNLAEDGKTNIEVPSNFWVTVNPRTGEVRTAEMNAVTAPTNLIDARTFATQHFTNIGGF